MDDGIKDKGHYKLENARLEEKIPVTDHTLKAFLVKQCLINES